MKIENAKIVDVFLGYEDHGIFTMMLHLEMDGSWCAFGTHQLDEYDKETDTRTGTAYGMDYITEVLKTVGVDDVMKLKGKHIRIESEGWGSGISRIGHLMKNVWFDPKEFFESRLTS